MTDDTAADAFDPAALRARYRAERDRRLTAAGSAQYETTQGAHAHYLQDPYIEAPLERPPLDREVDVVVIGGGFGGMMAAARLREAGVEDLYLIEKGADFGGTWYWNRYPGAACDIESYIYLPLLEELGAMPSEKYVKGPEILEHSRAIGRRYGLYDKALFQTEVTELRWDEPLSRWIVSTGRGDALKARFVCMSTGPLHRPKLPGIPGIEDFQGHSFHTSRWDYAYTGGGPAGDLTGLAGKRVGIIGTGATAVQCVPHLAAGAAHLTVFQRTPSSVDARYNRPTDPAWAAGLQPGWQQARMDNFNILVSGGRADQDLVADGWTEALRPNLDAGRAGDGAAGALDLAAQAERRQMADFRKMEQIRARVDATVRDPATAEALKPWYNQMCKRPCFHDDYLDVFNRPNVTLVDTGGRGVERITASGVVAGGTEHPVDCLIYATGFEFQSDHALRTGYSIIGRGGMTQSEKWKDGAATLYGVHSRGFPNCFIMGNAQQANTPNFTHMLNYVSRHIAYVVRRCLDSGVRAIEPTQAAEDAWVAEVMSFANVRRTFDEECTPGYYNNEGQPSDISVRNNFYGGGPLVFIEKLDAWRAEDRLSGFELR